jgi:NADH-quinone oxidoreductase subunit C
MNAILERLGREFDITDVVARKPDGLTTLKIDSDSAETLIRELRDREGFTHLNFMTCIDYIEQGIFTLVYMLHNHQHSLTLGIHVDIPRDQPVMTSIHRLWAQAWTYQRELREMYGIDFPAAGRFLPGGLGRHSANAPRVQYRHLLRGALRGA